MFPDDHDREQRQDEPAGAAGVRSGGAAPESAAPYDGPHGLLPLLPVEDPVFERDDYQAFAKDIELALLDIEEPEEVQIRKILPAIAERLSVLHQSLARDVNEWSAQTKERLDNIKSRLEDLFEGRVSMTLSSTRRIAALAGCSTPASMTTVTSFHSLPTSPPNPASRSPHPTAVSAAAAMEGMDNGIGGRHVRARVGRSLRAALAASSQRKSDVRPVEGDHQRDSETAGRRNQHGRGGGRGRAGPTARSTIATSAVSTVKPAEEIYPTSSRYIMPLSQLCNGRKS